MTLVSAATLPAVVEAVAASEDAASAVAAEDGGTKLSGSYVNGRDVSATGVEMAEKMTVGAAAAGAVLVEAAVLMDAVLVLVTLTVFVTLLDVEEVEVELGVVLVLVEEVVTGAGSCHSNQRKAPNSQ